ncbi:hypothetical protein SOASR030_35190 [Leminorella grimontii]|uniref:Autotransporter domain-containing protein n=1 Tax=Leminorella grimontii TaxID=82981 RepID=A0AAV5NA16_9GAMM|nr:autotransporter outer membrane beta-barrel domain-containing protein [Leminorella grimontii]GKX57407.1 hypothetical protein SOASR030_35190 [Leminorella grimontii]
MKNITCSPYEYCSEPTGKPYKRISLACSSLLVGFTPYAFADVEILAQTGTYTLSGSGPFILAAPHVINAPGQVGIVGRNTADWALVIDNGAGIRAENGVYLDSQNGRSVLNNSGNIISSGRGNNGDSFGVRLQAGGTVSNSRSGVVNSQSDGIFVMNGGKVVNDGLIQGGGSLTAVYFKGGNGVYVGSDSSTLSGGYGVITNAGYGEVINAGNISVKNYGVWFRNGSGGKLINQEGGTIVTPGTASTQYSVLINSHGTVEINNQGSIIGGTGVFINTDNHTFTNGGSVVGRSGIAVSVSGDNNVLVLTQGSSIDGAIVSLGGGNTLTLRESGVLTSDFFGLERVVVEAGHDRTWVLGGSAMSTTAEDSAALNVKSGALVLNGALTHAGVGGGTAIASGASLWIHPPGELNGDVANDGVLAFAHISDKTFAGKISGVGTLFKDDEGVLLLTNPDSSYTGPTVVNAGTLRAGAANIINDSDMLSLSPSGVFDLNGFAQRVNNLTGAGTVHLTDSALTVNQTTDTVFNGVIDGKGSLIKAGDGLLVFTGDHDYTGATDVYAGALILGNNARLLGGGGMTIHPSGTLGGYGSVVGDVTNRGTLVVANAAPGFGGGRDGHFTISGSLINGGEIRLMGPAATSMLSVGGDYVGDNGQLTLNTRLGHDVSQTDRLVILGNTNGATRITINNLDGEGTPTVNGIEVVSVGGQSDGQFSLASRVTAGIHEYDLHQGGVGASAGDGNWYLRTLETPRPETGVYLRNLRAASTMFMHTMHDRRGEQLSGDAHSDADSEPAAWVRIVAERTNSHAADGYIDMKTNTEIVHLGGDLIRWSRGGIDRWHMGVMGAFGQSHIDADVAHSGITASGHERAASGDVDGYSAGVYLTWFGQKDGLVGPYVDVWGQYAWYDNRVQGKGHQEESYDSRGWIFSVESGYAFSLGENRSREWFIEPQGQVAYNIYRTDNHREANDTRVRGGDTDSAVTRLGVRLHSRSMLEGRSVQPFIEANWWHDTTKNDLSFNGKTINDNTPSSTYELKLGLQGEVAGGWQAWGHIRGRGGENDYRSYGGMLGVKKRF